MHIARRDITLDEKRRIPKGAIVPPETFPQPEIQVRAGLLWHLDDEALGFAVEHLKQADAKSSGGKKR